MKKYFLGIVAVVLAIGFSAFKSSKLSTVTFYYIGLTDLSEMQDPTKWRSDLSSGVFECNGVDEVTCSFQIDESHVESGHLNHSYTIELGSGFLISTIKDGTGTPIAMSSQTRADME
jgi:hypothetical protein